MQHLEEMDAKVCSAIVARSRSHVATGLAHFEDPHDVGMYWTLYRFKDKGRTAAERWDPPAHQRAWVQAQQRAEIAIYHVLHNGRLRHLRTGHEVSLSRAALSPAGSCLLGRVVEYEDVTLLMGEHPTWLPLGLALLLKDRSDLELIEGWNRAAAYHDEEQYPLEAFLNTGHPRLTSTPWMLARSPGFQTVVEECVREAEDGFPPGLLRFALSLRGKRSEMQQGMRVEVRLLDTPVRRTLDLPPHITLDKLHKVLQLVMGWKDYHLHRFEIGDDYWVREPGEWEEYCQDEKGVLAAELLTGPHPLLYRYDFGDDRELELRLDGILAEAPPSPRCRDGAGSSPPEDCGPYWDASAPFDLAAKQGALDRHYRRVPAKPPILSEVERPPSEEELRSLKEGRSSPPLESYRLGKLSLVRLMVATLLEAGCDLTLEEVAQRLQRAQVPLPHGIMSLRKAWKRSLPLRETLGGKLGLVRQGAEFRAALRDLTWNLREKYPPAQPVLPAPEPPDDLTPLSPQEVVGWQPPVTVTIRQRLTALLDAHGGRRSVADLINDLKPLVTAESLPKSLAGKNLALGFSPDRSELQLDQSRPEVARVRALVRATKPVPRVWTFNPGYQDALREKTELLRLRWATAPRALVHLWFGGPRPCGVARDREGTLRRLEGEAVRDYLRSLEVIVGLDPWTAYERLEVPIDDRTVVDLASTRLPLDELMLTCGAPLLTDQALLTTRERLPLLERDLPSLERVHRYGLIHGYVGNREVSWNPGLQPTLYSVVRAALEQQKAVRLTLRAGTDDFVPRQLTPDHLIGIWKGREAWIEREDVLDFDVPAGLEVKVGSMDLYAYA